MSEVASQSEEVQTQEMPLDERINGAMEMFGLTPNKETEVVTPESSASDEQEDHEVVTSEAHATEQPANVRKVKFNKQEVEVDESQIDELIQKGLALDKVREKQSDAEKALQRAAKLAGYDKVDDYLKNLDTIEQSVAKQKQDQFDGLRKQMREDYENAGMDPTQLEEWLDNNPLLLEAKKVLEREQQSKEVLKQQESEEMMLKGWEALFQKYPTIADEMGEDGSSAPWLTPEMKELIDRNYDPIHAYEIVHGSKMVANEKEKARQDVLKQQRLNKRAAVEGNVPAEPDDGVPENVKGAFALFGLDPSTAKKFITKK